MSQINKRNGGSNDKKIDDDELALLASLGSSVTNADTYEHDVIRTAELQNTPRVTGRGLPNNLTMLAPSGTPLSDIPHVQSVLKQIRTQIVTQEQQLQQQAATTTYSQEADKEQEQQLTKLYLKEQILLSFLLSVAKDGDVFIHPQQEFQQEQRRRKRYTTPFDERKASAAAATGGCTVSVPDSSTTNKIPSNNKGKAMKNLIVAPPPKSVLKKKRPPSEDDNNNNNNNTNSVPKELSASERLELIKSSTNKKAVSFSSNLDDDDNDAGDRKPSARSSLFPTPAKRRRTSMMKHKQKGQQQQQISRDDSDKDDSDAKTRKQRLREMRKEREERAKKRRQQWMNEPRNEDEGGDNNKMDDDNQMLPPPPPPPTTTTTTTEATRVNYVSLEKQNQSQEDSEVMNQGAEEDPGKTESDEQQEANQMMERIPTSEIKEHQPQHEGAPIKQEEGRQSQKILMENTGNQDVTNIVGTNESREHMDSTLESINDATTTAVPIKQEADQPIWEEEEEQPCPQIMIEEDINNQDGANIPGPVETTVETMEIIETTPDLMTDTHAMAAPIKLEEGQPMIEEKQSPQIMMENTANEDVSNIPEPVSTVPTISPTTVTCPLCRENISIPNNADGTLPSTTRVDDMLVSHMQACQQQQNNYARPTRGGQRRSTRVRSAVKSYAEDDDNDEGDIEVEQTKIPARPSSIRSSRTRRSTTLARATASSPTLADAANAEAIDGTAEVSRSKSSRRTADEPVVKEEEYEEEEKENDEEETEEAYVVDDDEIGDTEEDDELDSDLVVEDPDETGSALHSSNKRRRRSAASRTPPPSLRKPPSPVDDLDEMDYEDRVDEWIATGVQNMRDMKERDQSETPPGEEVYDGGLYAPAWINDRLFPYQRTAVQWMWELHRQEAGGMIGDEMGLGKTVQVCGFLGMMASSRKLRSVLVISPATMLSHWLKELAKWAPGLRRVLIHQSGEGDGRSRSITPYMLMSMHNWLRQSRKNRLFEVIDEEDLETRDPASFCGTGYVFVTTYENIRRFPDIWTNHDWSYVVMDEAQKIRNPDADVTLACKRLRTPHRLALSGTPIQNDLKELWSLFDFVFPGRLGTLPAFENEFAVPIRKGGYSNATPLQVQLAYRCALILRDLINPYLLRRQKKDIKEVSRMPGRTEQVLFCRLGERQRDLYEAFLKSDQVKSVLRGSALLLGAITTLRKICNHPDLVCPPDKTSLNTFISRGFLPEATNLASDASGDDDDDDSLDEGESLVQRSGKLEVLAKILPLWKEQGHRVLIFCQWKKMLNIIQRFTVLQGWKFGRLDGNTNVAARQRLVDNFNSDLSYFGILSTTRTGGVGLNLTGASRVILYDPDWNPMVDAQARERAWRFGQEKDVTIYRLITAGTVEEKIYQRQIFKTALSNKILQDPKQRRLFSQKDLKDLFSLKEDGGSVISGGEGLTETGELTKGEGYIDPDEDTSKDKSQDNGDTLKTVLKSHGLAGVFDHQLVENHDLEKSTAVREMEARAKRIAKEALSALEESVAGHDKFTPTWTGTEDDSATGRFGGARFSAVTSSAFGGTSVAGAAIGLTGSAPSSNALLASLRGRNEDIKSGGHSNKPVGSSTKKYSDLLEQIIDFVRRTKPTTDDILDEFSNVPDCDAAIFRRLLNSVASVKDGRWFLKKARK